METTTGSAGVTAAFAAYALSELRALKAEGAPPDLLAAALAGGDAPDAHAFRRELLAAGANANAIGRGLRGCDAYEAHALRGEIAPETVGMRPGRDTPKPPISLPDERQDGQDPRNVLAWSLCGCASDAARTFREILLEAGAIKKCIAWSLSGCEDPRDFALREDLLADGVAPAFVANGLRGCDGKDAWRLRERLLSKGVRRDWLVRGAAGCRSTQATALWRELADIAPTDVAISLVGRDDGDGHALRRHILAKDPSRLPDVLTGLAGCDSEAAWEFRRHAEAAAHPAALALGLAGCGSERASALRARLRGGAPIAAVAASYFGDGERLTWLGWRPLAA